MPNSDPEGRIFLSAPEIYDRFFFLHTFWSSAFDFNVGVAINESCWRPPYWKLRMWRCNVVNSNVLTTELRDLLYNQCIENACCYLFFIYPTGWIKVRKIWFVSTGENRRKPCPVCKKNSGSEVTQVVKLYKIKEMSLWRISYEIAGVRFKFHNYHIWLFKKWFYGY